MSELIKRVLVAVIGIPIAIWIVYDGGLVFLIAILLLSSIGLFEFYKMVEKKDSYPNYLLGLVFNTIIIIRLGLFPNILENTENHFMPLGFFFLITTVIYVLLLMGFEIFRSKRNPLASISYTITGSVYVTFTFAFFLIVRKLHEIKQYSVEGLNQFEDTSEVFRSFDNEFSMLLLLFILFSVWLSDSAAYFIGKNFGRHKLAPRVSPKKTWEGAVAGFVAGATCFVLLSISYLDGLPLVDALIIAAIIGSVGQIGDLAESQLKRDAGIKDSSALIPGHGGVLDRFDSLIFIMPAVAFYMLVVHL